MAQKTITLELTVQEEKALARLIGYLCKTETDETTRGELSAILGENSGQIEQIGRINGALNAIR